MYGSVSMWDNDDDNSAVLVHDLFLGVEWGLSGHEDMLADVNVDHTYIVRHK